MTPTASLIARIVDRHERLKRGSAALARELAMQGLDLMKLREQVPEGEWDSTLAAMKIARSTAYHYMKVAGRWDFKKNQFKDGIHLCNLLRESDFKLLPELQGGGNRLGKDELARRRAQQQLLFDYDRVAPVFDAILNFDGDNPLLSAEDDAIAQMEKGARRILSWTAEARREKEAMEV